MKKIIVPIVFLCISFFQTNAQSEFRFGFQTSPTFSWMNTNDNSINGNGTNLGLKLGLMGEKYFQENYGFTFGINFGFNQGGTLKYQGSGNIWPEAVSSPVFLDLPNNTELTYNLQYLEIPFAFRMRTQEFGYFRYHLDIPSFTLGILTQAKGDITTADPDFPDATEEDIRKAVNLLSFGLGLSGGVEYSIGENISLIGGIGFQTSLLDVTKDRGTNYIKPVQDSAPIIGEEDSSGKVNVITVRLGILF